MLRWIEKQVTCQRITSKTHVFSMAHTWARNTVMWYWPCDTVLTAVNWSQARHAILPNKRLLKRVEKNVDQSQHTCRSRKCTLDLRNFARDSRKDQKGLIKGDDLPLLEQTTPLTHTPFVLEATLAIPLTKLSRRLNLQNGSQLYYKTMNCEEKNSAFCSVTMYHPTVASPKENLYLYE